MAKSIYCFLGLPASGKGTQAKLFAGKANCEIISIGDLVREYISKNSSSEKATLMKQKYDQGIPQDDQTIFGLIQDKIASINAGIVLDNFPFSEGQAEFVKDLMEKYHFDTATLVYIEIKPETAKKRIGSRKICPVCKAIFKEEKIDNCSKCGVKLVVRSDDNEETLDQRIKEYLPRAEKVIETFNQFGQIIRINGEPDIELVTREINHKVK